VEEVLVFFQVLFYLAELEEVVMVEQLQMPLLEQQIQVEAEVEELDNHHQLEVLQVEKVLLY
jgi:hypothetical protein